MASEAFKDRILNDLLPAFCNDPARNYDMAGFKANFRDIHEADAEAFLKGLDVGLVQAAGNMYRAARSGAREQLFTEGQKKTVPRPITIWAETIIVIATLSRLHCNFGWPKELLGTQSSDGAFDVIAFLPDNLSKEYIACEVKKTDKELDYLTKWMLHFGAAPSLVAANDKEVNAYRKVAALRIRQIPLFWAVGPGRNGTVFRASYPDDGRVVLQKSFEMELRYPL